jgi:hypothetical protein
MEPLTGCHCRVAALLAMNKDRDLLSASFPMPWIGEILCEKREHREAAA